MYQNDHNYKSSYSSKPCPKCGGNDRFYRVSQSSAYGNQPAWFCRQCNHSEPDASNISPPSAISAREPLTPEELAAVWVVNEQAVSYCQELLWSRKGQSALDYLRERGFSDEIIRELRLGYHNPKTTGSQHKRDYGFGTVSKDTIAARNAGLLNKFGYFERVLKNVITIPYITGDKVVMLRARSLDDCSDAKYFSPAGPLFAGAQPFFYLHDVLNELRARGTLQIALTEGEFKAAAMYAAWKAGEVPFPAIGQTGIAYLPDELIDELKDFTVYLIYDSEERKEPFKMSAGEKFTRHNGRKLKGWHLYAQIKSGKERIKALEKNGGTEQELEDARRALNELIAQADTAKARNIKVKVVRLPRTQSETKTDIDAFLLRHGASILNEVLERAQTFESWYAKHSGKGYKFDKGGIYRGDEQLADYQAILTQNIARHDGTDSIFDRVIIVKCQLPLNRAHSRSITIAADDWADPRKAMNIIRANLPQGASFDEGLKTLKAIQALSQQGDGPSIRETFTVTGWQQLTTGWHFLTGKGAINREGVAAIAPNVELNKDYKVDGYTLGIGEGEPNKGWEGTKFLLSGDVAPKAVCYMLLSHVALSVIHRFANDRARPVPFIYGESGSLKTSLCRVFLSYFGPGFTAVRGDGQAVLKWGTDTAKLMLNAAFYMRDVMFLMDDYKKATVRLSDLALVLHSISEGSGRGRLTQRSKAMASKPPRGLGMITGESLPAKDTGQLGRILPYPIRKGTRFQAGDVDTEMLTVAQEYGEDGHFAAFMREFIQYLANILDAHGEDELKKKLRLATRQDTLKLGAEHYRVAGGLRQNFLGFAVFTTFLLEKEYIGSVEHARLASEYNDARLSIAGAHSHAASQENPAEEFISVIRDGLNSGEIELQGDPLPEFANCLSNGAMNDGYPTEMNAKLIGFYSNPRNGQPSVALFPNPAFGYVQSVLARQGERINYNKADIWAQLHSAGYINKTTVHRGGVRYDALTSNKATGKRVRAINLVPRSVLGESINTYASAPTEPTFLRSPQLNHNDGSVQRNMNLNPYGF